MMSEMSSVMPMPHNRAIRLATLHDLDDIMVVLDAAREIMRSSGNMNQWTDGYPTRRAIIADINCNGGYVVEDDGNVVAYFAMLPSPEPTYATISGGAWLDDTKPYHVVHRMGKLPSVTGIFRDVFDFCFRVDPNIRIDTHRDNIIMQKLFVKHGFSYCGIIYLQSGDERLAYQRAPID